jgi:asparagine synthase (glutamine-hydrolysing)
VCGIAGFAGGYDAELLGRMGRAIAHRGPDDDGLLLDRERGVGLVHRRLAIIDLSPQGHQPMWDATKTVAIVFNGEIFNYRELREPLEAQGHAFASRSDTEVLLNLYLRDGLDMLSAINGMFAFALWDTRSRRLLIARDGVGVKPLYWSRTSRGFLFASEIKALLECEDVGRDLDPLAIQAHMAYLWAPAPMTILKDVKKLPPGHAMLVEDGAIRRTWCYYDLPYAAPPLPVAAPEAIERVRTAVATAVKRQMVADVPVGSFLSGGLDSSAVVAFASRESAQPMDCFTIGLPEGTMREEGFADDLTYARRVAAAVGARLHVVDVDPEMAGELETMLWHLDEPQADPAPINSLLICRLARQTGLKVLLSGTGGDDIFTGYRRHLAITKEWAWGWLPRGVRAAAGRMATRIPSATPLGRRAQKAMRYAALDGDHRLVSYFYWLPPGEISGLYGPALRDALSGRDPAAPLLETLNQIPADASPLRKMLYLEGKHFLADHNLGYADKTSMASGVEVRVPLLDPDLIALAASLPDALKQHGTVGKWVFKKAMEPVLPREVIYRPKTGFGAPIRRWMRHELKDLVDDTLSRRSLAARGLFDPDAVERLRRLDAAGALDGSYAIWTLVCLEVWCRLFLKAPVRVGAATA